MTQTITPMNPLLRWVGDMASLYSNQPIKVPTIYEEMVVQTKALLVNDTSGMVNTVLDFAIESALLDYTIETKNEKLTEKLTDWMDNINSSLRGKIPTGLNALGKEYFKERWKGSSFLLLRSIWENVDGFIIPTKLWFVNGEDIVIKAKKEDGTSRIGDETYHLIINRKNNTTGGNNINSGTSGHELKALPNAVNEMIFVQKPYASWASKYPVPFLIMRGLFKNLKLLELITSKGEIIVTKAIEYIFSIKKGSEGLALQGTPDFIYSNEDLTSVKKDFSSFLANRKITPGVPTYVTNFDTDMSHIIPDYSKAINQAVFAPIERRILAGLGLIDIIQGLTSTRKESTLNPRPFISEVESGVNDFKSLINDIIQTIIEKNRTKHPKYFGIKIIIRTPPIKQFITDKSKELLRSLYDRGLLSKQTTNELIGDVDFDIEVQRRENENKEGLEKKMFPPITQNVERDVEPTSPNKIEDIDKKEKTTEDKKGPEAKNFKQSTITTKKDISIKNNSRKSKIK